MLCLKTGRDFFSVIENTNPPKFRGIGTQHYFCPVTLYKIVFVIVMINYGGVVSGPISSEFCKVA